MMWNEERGAAASLPKGFLSRSAAQPAGEKGQSALLSHLRL